MGFMQIARSQTGSTWTKWLYLLPISPSPCCCRIRHHIHFSRRPYCNPSRGRPPGGARPLIDPADVFSHNNWDNVVWDEEQQTAAEEMIKKNTQTLVKDEKKEEYEKNAEQFWDKFYDIHQNRFFKDRHWLFTEFPELAPKGVPENVPQRVGLDSATVSGDQEPTSAAAPSNTKSEQPKTSASDLDSMFARSSITEDFPGQHATSRFLEVGCGVGNTVFPILGTNFDPGLFVYCCDLSPTAIQIVKDHTLYSTQRCHAFVSNVAEETAELPFPDGSLDIIILIFVLSAISPEKMQATINRLSALLKPGGLIVFRDYGRYDLAQLRFKDGKCLSDNFYVRGDGTRVYFFTQEELREMFVNAGLVEEQNLIDRRLQVNRGRQLKMYRIWIQCKYRKPHPTEHTTDDR